IGKEGILPAGVVLTGGGSKLEDLIEATKEELRLPAAFGNINTEMGGFVDKLSEPVYAASVSLMLYALEVQEKGHLGGFSEGGVYGKAKNFFKQFLP
ncbi:MAG: hypothetical protein U0946_02675, partial [Patescibacteria group bacterium]|nr:hypothetical protein [Patescibacteria group bacterium]